MLLFALIHKHRAELYICLRITTHTSYPRTRLDSSWFLLFHVLF